MQLPNLFFVFAFTRIIEIHAFVAQEFSIPRSLQIPSIRVHNPSPRILKGVTGQGGSAKDASDVDEESSFESSKIDVYDIFQELHNSELPFRIIVIGNGVILESTNVLGPTYNVSESKKTGMPIATFASEDKSFEFHVKPNEIKALALTEKQSPVYPDRTMRSLRFTNDNGPVCILIVGDEKELAPSWFQTMVTKYGSEIEF